MTRKVLTERDVKSLPPGSPCYVEQGTLLTPLAREIALERQNTIVEFQNGKDLIAVKRFERRIALGSDGAGRVLKDQINTLLQDNYYCVMDCGIPDPDKGEVLDLTVEVASHVRERKMCWGIVIEGSGLSSCMVANKVPGIRAVHCYDRFTAKSSRECADSNLLTLAAWMTTFEQATLIVMTFLNTTFGKKNHHSQVGKITEIEQRFGPGYVAAVSGDPYCAL